MDQGASAQHKELVCSAIKRRRAEEEDGGGCQAERGGAGWNGNPGQLRDLLSRCPILTSNLKLKEEFDDGTREIDAPLLEKKAN
eukprot:2875069-Rhodomonas_salina.1